MLILLRAGARACLLATVLLTLGPLPLASADESPEPATTDQMDAFVQDRMDATDVPGVAYAIVGPEGVRHTGAFGEDGNGDPVSESTPFLWGSVAKPIAATVVMQLAGDGRLRLDEPVTTYLPDFRLRDERHSDRITVRHLVAQTGGIPDDLDLTDRFDDAERRPADVLPELADREPVSDPGEEHVYSSVNYLVLAAVIEEVTGRPYTDVLTERVLRPAGMDDAVTTPDQADDAVPPGNRFAFGRAVGFSSSFDPAGVAYGYLGGTLHDAARFVQANLGDADTVLDRARREQMYRGEVETGEDRTYGLGWRAWPVEGTDSRMIWHSGASPGYFASMILLPDRNVGIVVLQNAYGKFQENELLSTGFGLAQLAHGKEPDDATGTDPLLWGLLGALGMICLTLAGIAIRSVVRVRRPRDGAPTKRRLTLGLACWVLALGALAYLVAVALPGYYGAELGQLGLWVPDVLWLAYAVLVLAAVVLALRIAITVRH